MYASNLEQLLYELMKKADASHAVRSEFAARFDSLRRYGRLPRGRANHATPLTDAHIADAIFGLASSKPGWAGHVAILLASLQPVGGPVASFGMSPTLGQLVQLLISDKSARDSMVTLVVSSAESGVNANGYACLTCKADDQTHSVHFEHRLALSLAQAGAEKDYQPEQHLAPASAQLVFNRRFFDYLARSVARIRSLKQPPVSDGSEYDAEEAEERRFKKLGVQKGSYYLNVGVDNQVTWPKEETLVTFDQYQMVLFPKTKEHVQSISFDLTANKVSIKEANTIINRFLSIMTWCDDQFAVAQDGWAGNPIPVPVPRRNLAFTTAHHWIFDRKIPSSENVRRALALYREARNAEQNYLVSYAVLNYYKTIEILFPTKPQAKAWMAKTLPAVAADIGAEVQRRFDDERGAIPAADHIYDAYRLAVAHASPRQASDPDSSGELTRLHIAAEVLRPLARHFIQHELRVSDSTYSGD